MITSSTKTLSKTFKDSSDLVNKGLKSNYRKAPYRMFLDE